MTVDLEAIARRGRCEISSLRIALPLLQQGYTPPYLARYRRDELGGIDEGSLWMLSEAVAADEDVRRRREELSQLWKTTELADPAIGKAIEKAHSKRLLDRLSRRLKLELSEKADAGTKLALRFLNPQKGDGGDPVDVAEKIDSIDPSERAAAVAGLDEAIAKRLCGDPRVIGAAVRWLAKNSRIHIAQIHDPHGGNDEPEAGKKPKRQKKDKAQSVAGTTPPADTPTSADTPKPAEIATPAETATTTDAATPAEGSVADTPSASPVMAGEGAPTETPAPEAAGVPTAVARTPETETPAPENPTTPVAAADDADTNVSPPEKTTADQAVTEQATADQTVTDQAATDGTASEDGRSEAATVAAADGESEPAPPQQEPTAAEPPAVVGEVKKTSPPMTRPASPPSPPPAPPVKKAKKISPRQRRRRWLVSVLKPLQGKRLPAAKMSAFQIVMLGRALRSQVAICSFEYDAKKLVDEIQRSAMGLNRSIEAKLRETILVHEANIREAAESAWWDELQEQASARLVGIAADNLRSQVNRGGIDAKVAMSIDAIGPRTAATAIVSADGRVLHHEDIPCQLSKNLRSQAVLKMGELIHAYGVDLIIVSNGPARRASLAAIGDLIDQSPEQSIRWTVADRNGADTYAGGPVADQEMRSTPRRFRAASWIAFSVLQPAQALAKVDPLKLRLGSFQRELSDDALTEALKDVMTSGASRGGVDVNAAPVTWLSRLPGMDRGIAQAIDTKRRDSLIKSRQELASLEAWKELVSSRQALPFLRVFGSDQPLDSTLIHPDDYALSQKLAKALDLQIPPAEPPGYVPPSFESDSESAGREPTVKSEVPTVDPGLKVETFESRDDSDSQSFADKIDATAEPESDSVGSEDPPSPPAEDAAPNQEPAAGPESEVAVAADESSDVGQPDVGQPDEEATAPVAEGAEAAPPAEAEAAAGPPTFRQPLPDVAKVDKCIKEWQIGRNRAYQLVHWLCDPFGDSDPSGHQPATMHRMPSLKNLKPGDQVIGVVVGVMPFGVFVELAPDCSGLVHVSRLSENYVEDLHEVVQVGDVITGWVTGTDEKRRRVALSAFSPQREAELEQQRSQQRSQQRGGFQGGRGGQRDDARGGPGGQRRGGGAAQGQGQGQGQNRGGGAPARGGGAAAGKTGGGNRAGGGRPEGGRGGRSGGGRQGGRDNRRGGSRKPEVYRVAGGGPEQAPITEKMKAGAEPLRSFGDLAQFLKPEKPEPPAPEPAKPEPAKPEPAKPEPAKPEPEASAPVAEQSPHQEAAPEQTAPQQRIDPSVSPDPPAESSGPVNESSGPADAPPSETADPAEKVAAERTDSSSS